MSKAIALDRLSDGQPRPFVGEFIRFKLIGNPGAALSLGASNTWVMTAIALGVLVAIVFVARGLGSRAWAIALGLLLGSAVGNCLIVLLALLGIGVDGHRDGHRDGHKDGHKERHGDGDRAESADRPEKAATESASGDRPQNERSDV